MQQGQLEENKCLISDGIVITVLDKRGYQLNIFLFFPTKIYVVDTH